jgi:hypothetical protein
MNRRTLLRSLAGTTIGLPFLEEMSAATKAADAAIPMRAFNLFFGLGIPSPLQKEGFDGVMEPLKPLSDKLLIMRGVDHVRADQSGINAHFDGSSAAFTATAPNGEARAGGASLDQLLRQVHYPQGQPDGVVPTLVAGTFFRRSRISRYVHSYHPDGTVAAAMQERPIDLFARVFGRIKGADKLDTRLQQSVLDSVLEQYRHYSGKNSPLGSASKDRFKNHLDRIREYEQRAFQFEINKDAPPKPAPSQIPHGGKADPGGQGLDMELDTLVREWRLMAELYALAIQTDRARFGSLTFLAAGERLRIKGDYIYNGEKRFTFDDSAQLRASGDKGCSHEWWHKFNEKKKNEQLRAHAHMKMREVAHFLSLLSTDETREANGKTIVENAMITISTESGDGRHNDTKRELSGVFHACTGANGRLKTGQIVDVNAEGLDVYNTMARTTGTQAKLGPQDRTGKIIDKIIA